MNVKNTKVIYLNANSTSDDTEYFLTINDILDQKVDIPINLFINDYQRPYCWHKKQIEELIKDIEACSETNSHFTGVLYFGKSVSNHGCSIIDGQQRLITIFLILKYLGSDKNFKISVKIDNEDSCKYYSLNDMIDNTARTATAIEIQSNNLLKEYKRNINTNYKKCIEKIFSDFECDREAFKEKLFKYMYFLAIKCDDANTENILFRIVNAKGQLLDDIDKVKSFLLSNYYDKVSETKHFIELWSKLNKSGKKSLNVFFKILMNELTKNKKNSSGKIKFEKFEAESLKNPDFKSKFEAAIERFEWIPTDFKNVENSFTKKMLKKSTCWKNVQAACFLINKLGLRDKFTAEIGDSEKFNDYKTGKLNPILLFMLYLFTYICETNYSFSGVDNIAKIDEFQALNNKERKQKLKELFHTFKQQDKLSEIQYKQKGVNENDDKINQKHKCLYPLLLLMNVGADKDYFEKIIMFEKININKDHYIPKVINEKSVPKKERSPEFTYEEITEKFKRECIVPIYNCRLLSEAGNKTKSNIMPNEFRIYKDDKCTGFDYEKMRERINQRKKEFIENLEELVNCLTK